MERNINLFVCLVFAMACALNTYSQVSKVEVTTNASGHFELQRNGVPYYIKGAGAKDHFDLLVKSGANSIRVWSTNNKALLDSAYQHDLTVTLGLYVLSGVNLPPLTVISTSEILEEAPESVII